MGEGRSIREGREGLHAGPDPSRVRCRRGQNLGPITRVLFPVWHLCAGRYDRLYSVKRKGLRVTSVKKVQQLRGPDPSGGISPRFVGASRVLLAGLSREGCRRGWSLRTNNSRAVPGVALVCRGDMTGCTSTQNGYCCPSASGFPEATLLLL